jgi:hypothetical protein
VALYLAVKNIGKEYKESLNEYIDQALMNLTLSNYHDLNQVKVLRTAKTELNFIK